MTLIAAISFEKVVAHQVIEGGVDSVLFENFIYQALTSIRKDRGNAGKDVIILMDNAVIHKHRLVLETARDLKVNVLFNAEYSPWLNPIEQLFGYLKKQLSGAAIDSK